VDLMEILKNHYDKQKFGFVSPYQG
jgi:regulator of nonsense transcripts 1